jgi:GGDEF domain-containing protein
MIDAFREQQKRYDVSISWGYAYTDERSKTSLKALMDEADKRMYEQKKNMHENGVMPCSLREAIEAGKTREGID